MEYLPLDMKQYINKIIFIVHLWYISVMFGEQYFFIATSGSLSVHIFTTAFN